MKEKEKKKEEWIQDLKAFDTFEIFQICWSFCYLL